jgi:ADP-ribose pyrophosphatase
MESKIRTLGSLYARSFSVDLDQVAGPREHQTSLRLVVRHPSAVVIVPVMGPGQTLLVRQFRYALGRETLEFPAGKLDPGEAPMTAARRELAEETGFEAGRLEPLLPFAPSLGYSTEIIHAFAAYDLTPAATGRDEAEISQVVPMTFTDLGKMARSGGIIDGTTLLALAMYEWTASTTPED